MLARSLGVCLLALMLGAASSAASVGKLVVDQMILPVTEEIIEHGITESVAAGDIALLIQLATPGGLEASTRRIVNRVVESPLPVIVWVAPSGERAASAGFILLMAADVAAMAPGTNTGAAHPVVLGVEVDEVMSAKMTNDSAAFIRSLAAKRGRNVEAAEKAVRESIAYTEEEALELELIDFIAADEAALLARVAGRSIQRFDGTTVVLDPVAGPIRPIEIPLRLQLLAFIMNPNVAFVLFSLGMLGLWAEFQNPGGILPGVVGALALLLAGIALNMLPTRYAALALVLAAFAFFALEAKFTSHGIFGTAGVLAMFIGAVLLVDGPIPEMRVSWITALAVSVPFGIIAIFLMTLVIRSRGHRVTTGEEGMVGEIGLARTELAPEGRVFVHGELWNAVSSSPVPAGQKVRVLRVRELRVEVEPVERSSEQ
ncbi:MAG TPA: nodulation protein NfeD [Thermoanaerobaculia bacterium]|nr:nodulation protein NfeD [Thermoanaerobaculia bacterium]